MSRLPKALEMGGLRLSRPAKIIMPSRRRSIPPGGVLSKLISTGLLGCAMIFAMTGVVGLCGLTACAAEGEADKPTAASCEKLRDHMVDLRFGGKAPPAVPGISKAELARDMAKHRANLTASLDKRLVPKCQREMSRDHVECSLGATSSADVGKCNSEFESEGVGR